MPCALGTVCRKFKGVEGGGGRRDWAVLCIGRGREAFVAAVVLPQAFFVLMLPFEFMGIQNCRWHGICLLRIPRKRR